VVGQYIFKPEGQSEKTQPTTIGIAGAMTEQKSYVLGAGYRGALEDDLWRVQSFVAEGRYNFDFYGVGVAAGQQGIHVPIEQSFKAFQVQTLRRSVADVYFGPRLTMTRLNLAVGAISGLPPGLTLPDLNRELNNVALGFRAQWDTRDDIFYPTGGYYVQSRLDWYRKAFGGDFNLQIFDVEYNHYQSLSNQDVLATRVYFHKASDGAPFFMLSSFGGNDLRGYEYGRYRDNVMIAGQGEWRHQLSPRWAAVGFAGVGSVAATANELLEGEALWSYGAGLRFRIAKEHKINFRLDWARGRDGDSLYFSVGEAF
jgi:outer membrane protein assembly factor BamA